MILSILVLFFITFVIIGYSYLFKILLYQKNNEVIKIYNHDFIYGVFTLSFLSIFLNFFIPLNVVSKILLFFGFIVFFYSFLKKKIKINLLYLAIIIIFFIFISHTQGMNYDSQLYHLQIIKMNTYYKSIFGIVNLEDRYGMNSSLHSLISLFNFSINSFEPIYLFSIVLFGFVINEIYAKNIKKFSNSCFFLSFSLLFIFLYSFFHPFGNGTILNNIGSPEVDITVAFFFIYTLYLFLKFYENNRDEKIIDQIIILSTLIVSIKVSYLAILLLPFYLIFIKKKLFNHLPSIIFSFLFGIIWSIKGFISSGCFIFPISITCIDTSWSLSGDKVENYKNIVMSFARDTPLRQKFGDFNYTLNSFDWLYPWFTEYFLKTEILYISTILVLICAFVLILLKFLTKKIYITFSYFYIILTCLISLLIWFSAPEVRFGYGTIISIVSISTTLLIKNFNLMRFNFNYMQLILILSMTLLIQKNFDNLSSYKEVFARSFNYDNFELIQKANSIKIYSPPAYTFCSNFLDFCTYKNNQEFYITKKKYIYFLNKS